MATHAATAGELAVAALAALALLLLAACSDHPTAPAPHQPSDVSALAALSAPLSLAGGGVVDVVYVSLPPGSVPGGESATVTNLATSQSRTVPMVQGGFDPLPLSATVGDELTLEIRGKTRDLIASAKLKVGRRTALTVVRTDPPKGKTDVAVNGQILVVFDEPVNAATVAGAVGLFRGSVPVSGTAVLAPSGLAAEFRPDALLAPNTAYELVVTTGAQSLSGGSLDASVHIPFTTGARVIPVATVEVQPPSATLLVGQTLELTATTKDSSGAVLSGSAITWVSSAPSVASVSSTGLVTALAPGFALISATSEGKTAGTTITVQADSAHGRIAFVSDQDGTPQLYVVNLDGSSLTRLTHDTASYGHPAWSPDARQIAVERFGQGIVVMNADGTGATLVAPDGSDPAWSPDGTRIRFAKVIQGGDEIDEVTADGAQTTTLCTGAFGSRLAWSPDRRTAAFEVTTFPGGDGFTQVYLNDDHCTGARRLTSPRASLQSAEGASAWSPDGQRIALWRFGQVPVESGAVVVSGIWIARPDGTGNLTPAFTDPPGWMTVGFGTSLSWSPDGRYIAFVRNGSGPGPEMWITHADGKTPPLRVAAAGMGRNSVLSWDLAWAPR